MHLDSKFQPHSTKKSIFWKFVKQVLTGSTISQKIDFIAEGKENCGFGHIYWRNP